MKSYHQTVTIMIDDSIVKVFLTINRIGKM